MDRTFEDVEDGSDLNFDETAAGIDFPGVRRSTYVRVPTERGLDFQLTLKRKNYNQCKKKLEDKLNTLDMNWTELSDPEALRKERTFIEDCRKGLMEGSSEFMLLLPSEYANDVACETDYMNRQAMELWSRRSGKTSSFKKSSCTSKHSSASQISLMKIKTMTELAKRKVEMQYARIEAQKQMEMQRKKYEIEEIQRLKSYESAKAEADAVAKIEDEEGNPKLLNLDQFTITKADKEERTCHCLIFNNSLLHRQSGSFTILV